MSACEPWTIETLVAESILIIYFKTDGVTFTQNGPAVLF